MHYKVTFEVCDTIDSSYSNSVTGSLLTLSKWSEKALNCTEQSIEQSIEPPRLKLFNVASNDTKM